MDPIKFGEDLARKAELAHRLATTNFDWPDLKNYHLLFTGMGSSAYAAESIVTRLQSYGHSSHLSLASNPTPPKAGLDKVLIAISATANSVETNQAVIDAVGYKSKIWLTNSSKKLDNVIKMQAGDESGQVASLTYLATHIALLKLCEQLGYLKNLESLILKAADAIEDIYNRQGDWLAGLIDHLSSPAGSFFIAPKDRFCSAQQSALMMRECPRRPAVGCETGDWAHVDLYLTKTVDYRAILFPGSKWEDQFFKWCNERGAKVATIGFDSKDANLNLRYKNDEEPIVRLLAEVGFIELAAQKIWVDN
jgi:glucosamine--fructose-6-phosphate aminotransferase (isomerizing)